MKPLRYALNRGIMNFPIRKRSKFLVIQENADQALPGLILSPTQPNFSAAGALIYV